MNKKFYFLLAALCCATMLRAAQYNDLKTIQSGGVERQYFLYVPDNLKPNSPLFISCHGMNQDYLYQKTVMKWLPLAADTASYVAVFPVGEAVSGSWGNMSSGWDMDGMKDVNFMLDIIDAVKADYNIDDTRVYMSGFSLGGAFAYYMAQKAPDRVAAVVSFSGYDILGGSVSCSRPMPIFHLHGDADEVMQYSGVGYGGIEDYLQRWSRLFSCANSPEVQTDYPLAYGSTGWGTIMTYKNCQCDVEVKLLKAPGIQHDWSCLKTGANEARAIIAFCKQYNTSCGKISPEAIENIVAESAATKRIDDGVLLIEKNGKTYTLQGQEVK